MTDLEQTASLAEKLQSATPVNGGEPTQQANLSSTYLNSPTWDVKSNAFLNDATIENQISTASNNTNEAEAHARAMWLDLSAYDPVADAKARELANANARKQIEEQQKLKAKAEQREKIAQFLRGQSAKDRRLWYSRWVFSWIFLTLWIIAVSTIFFKNNIISFLENDLDNYLANWSSMAAQLICDKIKLPENIKLTDDETTNKIASFDKILTFWWSVASHYSAKILRLIPTIGEAEASEITIMARPSNDEVEDNFLEEDADEELKISYTFTPVDSIEEANWVISKDCKELSCWDYSNEYPENLVLCEKFRQKEDMEDDAPRIWHSGACKYKDESELWYLSRE